MFALLKTKRLVVGLKQPSPVSFCCFFNQERVFVLFQNNHFMVVHINQSDSGRVVLEDSLQSKQRVLDCRRIKPNLCALVDQSLMGLTLIKYASDDEVLLGTIVIQEMQFFKSLSVTAEFLPFQEDLFIIRSELFSQHITYFTIFSEKPGKQFNYNISMASFQHDPVSSRPEIFKALPESSQLIFFKQNEEEEDVDWKVKFVPLSEAQKKEIDFTEFLSPQHWIADIVVKTSNEYYIFTSIHGSDDNQLQIFSVRLYQTNLKYVQQVSLIFTINPKGIFLEIIDFNIKKGYFLAKYLHHQKSDGVIYDNLLQMRSISTGELIDDLPCNLKSIDLCPNHNLLLDYSPGINEEEHLVLHIRVLLSKKSLYFFLMENGRLAQHVNFNMAEIFELL